MANKVGIKPNPHLNQIIGEFFSTSSSKEEENTKPIYQYTTWEGLKGIIESKCLRFTDYRFLNDSSEIKYAIFYFGKNLFSSSEIDINNFYGIHENVLHNYPFYIASMCMHKDYLPAWRMYADDGAGFAIGFNRKKIKDAWSQLKENEPRIESVFHNVHYRDVNKITKQQNEKFQQLRRFYEEIKGNKNAEVEFNIAIRSLFPLIKHECYIEEKEVRISVSNFCYSEMEFGKPRSRIQYKNNRYLPPFCNSIPYVEKSIEIDWITEIWTGPRVNEKHAEQEIKLLRNYDKSIKLHHSNLPYRNPEKWF